MRPSTASQAQTDSRVVRVDVDGDELVLVLVERDLERVEDEADVRFFVAVEGNQLLAEGLTEVVFLGKKGRTHAELEGTCTDDAGALNAGGESGGLDHGMHLRANSQAGDQQGPLEDFVPARGCSAQPSSSEGARRLCLMLRHSMTLAGAQAATNAPVKSASCRPSRGFVGSSVDV